MAISDSSNAPPEFWRNILRDEGYIVTRVSDKGRLHNLLNSLSQEDIVAGSNPVIAISDSSNSFTELCGGTLAETGYRLIKMPDKYRLLTLLGALLPDLIVTDVESPTMDGLELLEEVKIFRQTRDIPVIVISDFPGLKDTALNLGARECLTKPFGIDEFLNAVKSTIGSSPWRDWSRV